MNTPFTPPQGPFAPGQPPFGAGRRDFREARREARREFRDHLREHRGGPFGPGFNGPGGLSGYVLPFGPGFGPAFGAGGRGRGGRHGGRGRGRRGDVRVAILKLLAERPMHGYEMIQEIAGRTQQLWKPSPGSVYPTLQMLEDEGLIVAAAEQGGGRKLFELTDQGREAADKIETAPWDEITEDADPGQMNLSAALGQLAAAVAQSTHAASADQQQRIVDIVNTARREIYQILGED
ncbi:PadR family transcriptional regulator [Mycobacterium sp. ACS4331]|uniref:PadR family transcriptional regulator n=1 Tax=Mycobacterium sp. ACS4331 TaxID=1834121 RepID=UPI0007FE617B|nr:PadR family transcriptional regulator [Mycobacterium sp. ACS4331]OBF14091.1 PadR family transcriptional regulator [Mycobacterium sp. ACS4331]